MKKQYVKDGKLYALPILVEHKVEYVEDGVKKTKKVKAFTNDENIILKNGFQEYVFVEPKPSLDQLIDESNARINKITDEKILNGFVWDGQAFYLTPENQTNFANMYIAKNNIDYPQTVKTQTGFYQLENEIAVSGFYFAGVKFIKTCLEEGWKEKEEAEAEIRKNYK